MYASQHIWLHPMYHRTHGHLMLLPVGLDMPAGCAHCLQEPSAEALKQQLLQAHQLRRSRNLQHTQQLICLLGG
jgi:hypothetical protein